MFKRPKINVATAKRILAQVPPENGFYFHTAVGLYTGRRSSDLAKFCDAVKDVDIRSIGFHLKRGDFEAWIRFLGDNILAMQIAKLRKKQLQGESLRSKLYDLVNRRCNKLRALTR